MLSQSLSGQPDNQVWNADQVLLSSRTRKAMLDHFTPQGLATIIRFDDISALHT